ncbi:lysylphosphatidylglycerol synthase transmembrane domain-containing protein [Pseudoflavonifractor sp. MSJ-37]|uniref:lysylphosphatidylglycerol synthase transmembrane domain-containing protein n=1 Tax=Pseudoflavonifractor sp. MSJ-37 TaxID=2841531 RepID=UPI001C107F58|nr:lysylphosphatidylglycerol synthase transmembrane domain-containing protein [Pseudoflavonifractor sp. MSJ-37]MBU5436344.1 flippase-like domain-containing protein [Pseudoflavonifractor sp. MSJ-37]
MVEHAEMAVQPPRTGRRKGAAGLALLLGMMGLTAWLLLRDRPAAALLAALRGVDLWILPVGLALMGVFIGCEALSTHVILGRLGHRVPWQWCLWYSLTGFCMSSVTPSASGGQPAQVWAMAMDGIPAVHGALDMLLVAVSYQVTSLCCAAGAWLFLPGLRAELGGGMGLLLLYGGGVTAVLTAGMLSFLFLPKAAGRLAGKLLDALAALRLCRDRAAAGAKLERQMAEYAAGAAVLRSSPVLVPILLGLTTLQLTASFLIPYAVYRAFGLSGTGPAFFWGSQALLTLAVSALPLPGAVGPAEGGFVQVFRPVFGPALTAPAMLVSRGISFYLSLLVSGGAALAFFLRARRR